MSAAVTHENILVAIVRKDMVIETLTSENAAQRARITELECELANAKALVEVLKAPPATAPEPLLL